MNKDLKSRIPAAVLYVLVIVICSMSGTIPTIALLGVFYLLCLYEFLKAQKSSLLSTIATIAFSASLVLIVFTDVMYSKALLAAAIVSTCLLSINVLHLLIKKKNLIFSISTIFSAITYVTLPFAIGLGMVYQYNDFSKILLGIFVILWLNDAGAYFSGRAFGKNRLFPSISPNKTWEGLIGGGIIGTILSLLLFQLLQVLDIQTWLFISLIVWVSGSLGDLVESSWKRSLNLKDSGHLMGGHGGFLDRLDSFIYAIPFVSLFLLFLK